jgi:ATP-binding cassette subfamily F protein uup
MIFQLEQLTKSYTYKPLFKQINYSFTISDRIGLIGTNGTGKSTLLKIIAGLETADSGSFIKPRRAQVVYLPQEPVWAQDSTVLDMIFSSEDPKVRLIKQYELTRALLEKSPSDDALQQKLAQINDEMNQNSAWDYEREVKSILNQLGITNLNELMDTLSGGQQKRISLAMALVSPSDLLILDEPTNHLDTKTVEWLEAKLKQRKCAILMVTHDRYFLDRVVNRIVELEECQLFEYSGHYSDYLALKVERIRRDSVMAQKQERLYNKELEWMRAGVEARRTKQEARKQRFYALEESKQDHGSSQKLEIDLALNRLGKSTINLEDVSFHYPSCEPLIKSLTFTLLRDDRLGIIGENGTGKTTLLKLLTGELNPTQGKASIGQTVVLGYYRQDNTDLPQDARVIDYVREIAEYAKTKSGYALSATQMLERFLFDSEKQWTIIGKLSGGERRRLYLLGVLMSAPNVLVLDEPTNDLDVSTLGILEAYLDEFPGAVIVVSHDRYFIDRICERLLVFKENRLHLHTGNYSDLKEIQPDLNRVPNLDPIKKTIESHLPKLDGQKKMRLSYHEQREYEGIDLHISSIESKLDDILLEINLHQSDYVRLQELVLLQTQLEDDLLDALTKKEYFEEILKIKV